MSTKISEILEKASQDRGKGDFARALKRLREGIEKHPSEATLYQEAMEIALESGETLAAIDFFKQASRKIPDRLNRMWDFAADKVHALNDSILCKFLVDLAIRKRDLRSAENVLQGLKDHTATELLKRVQTKIQSLSSAMNSGFAFKGELVAGALAEGLLCFRAKRFQQGAKAFLRILEEKPVEHEVLTPYFEHLEQKQLRQGGISFVLGCCYLVSEKYVKAFPKLCQGAALMPSMAEDAIARLEAIKDRVAVPQEELNISLARLHIVKGDDYSAAERFGAVLEKNASKAPVIIDLLKPYVQEDRESQVLDYVYIEAALGTNKNESALLHIKKLSRDRRLRDNLLSWLDTKSQERFLPVDILSFYAELTLEQGRFERAVEIFREVVAQSPADARVITSILERHQDEPAVQKFYDDVSHLRPEVKPTTGGFEIEHFGGRDFTLDTHGMGAPLASPEANGMAPPGQDPMATPHEQPQEPADKQEQPHEAGDGARDQTLDTPETAEEPAAAGDSPPFEREHAEALAAHDETEPAEEVVPPPPVESDLEPPEVIVPPPPEMSEPSETVVPPPPEDLEPSETVAPPPPEMSEPSETVVPPPPEDLEPSETVVPPPPEMSEPPETVVPPPPEMSEPSETIVPPPPQKEREITLGDEPGEDFDSLYARFEAGRLPAAETLRLIEQAMIMGRYDEAKHLLKFTPENVGQEIKRKLYLAAYYMEKDQPLPALVILKAVPLAALSKEERRNYLLRTAQCYQKLNRFDAAHSVYLRIMSEEPDFEEIEEMAKRNYEKYLKEMVGEAPVLEKVTSL